MEYVTKYKKVIIAAITVIGGILVSFGVSDSETITHISEATAQCIELF